MVASFPGTARLETGWHPSPFGFTCPYCHVVPGAFCVNPRGQSRQLVHAARMDAANAWVPGHAAL